MKYQFDKVVNRRGSDCVKWDICKEGELPMWVADMDFEVAPEIFEALQKRLDRKVFGYSIIPDSWHSAYVNWWKRRHNLHLEREWLQFCTGVIPALSTIIGRLGSVGDNVVIQTPVYNVFYNSILNSGRHILENKLVYDGKGYAIDFDDLEEKLSNPLTTVMVLCNPQNPVGKIWDGKTLCRIGQMCRENGVTLISDEIHCDITEPNTSYVPYFAASEQNLSNSIMLIAPTKAFNLAGMKSSAVVVADKHLREKVVRALNSCEVAEGNAFAADAAIAAFNDGEQWLKEMCAYVSQNRKRVGEFLAEQLPLLHSISQEATYLLWIDCSKVTDNTDDLCAFVREQTGLFVTEGSHYGQSGKKFIRMNVACPKTLLEDGLQRLKEGVLKYMQR